MGNTTQKKIRNWKEYNKSLVKRGQLLLSFDEDFFEELYYKETQSRGGQKRYTPKMYEYLLTLKIMLRLPWRAAIGFAQGLLEKAFPNHDIKVPDYAHACREAGKLSLKLKPLHLNPNEGLNLAFDSTGLNVYSTSGHHLRKYGKALCRSKQQWKKVHIVLDLNSMQIVSMAYTESTTNDCEVVEALCEPIEGKINSTIADGAYDTFACYEVLHKRGARIIIPPATPSKAQDELKNPPKEKKNYLAQRDEAIHFIRNYETFEEGLEQWKIASGYHQRSRVEAAMFRIKRIFGFNLQLKNERSRYNEIIIKLNLLNQMTALGKAVYFD